jgi:hypothetical protein
VPISDGPAARHAARLLTMLGEAVPDRLPGPAPGGGSALADWAASGAMALTGRSGGPPLAAPGAPASAVRGALAAFAVLSGARALPGAGLLGERAALMGLARRGPWSAGGSFRVLRTRDGWAGVTLARPDDLESVPALVEGAVVEGEEWTALAAWALGRSSAAVADRAQLLGIPAGAVPAAPGAPGRTVDEQAERRPGWLVSTPGGPRRHRRARPLVVDLTALWAGPLCASLLGLAGAEVIKVESPARPDGARSGAPAFYDLLHAGHASVALDLASPGGRDALLRLIGQADLVLESSRPRALRQLGIDAEEAVAAGTAWLSITAYGRTGPWAGRVGFGDDVAAAAGLVVRNADAVMPCGDALADPLTGVHAAVAAAAALRGERACLLDVSMREVTALAALGPAEPHTVRRRSPGGWEVETADGVFPVLPPRARRAARPAAPLGADTAGTLARWGGP